MIYSICFSPERSLSTLDINLVCWFIKKINKEGEEAPLQQKRFLSATEFTIPWRTLIQHGGCRLSLSVCVMCLGANFSSG